MAVVAVQLDQRGFAGGALERCSRIDQAAIEEYPTSRRRRGPVGTSQHDRAPRKASQINPRQRLPVSAKILLDDPAP